MPDQPTFNFDSDRREFTLSSMRGPAGPAGPTGPAGPAPLMFGLPNVVVPTGDFTLISYATFAFSLSKLWRVATTTGSMTMTIKKNGTAITGYTSLAVTTTSADYTAAASFAVGDALSITFASVSGTPRLLGTLEGVRTL